jgi:hypothetical protein
VSDELADQISELQQVHKGLTEIAETENETVLSGSLPFEVSADGHSPITDSFDVELIIPDVYPRRLPRVRETAGKIDGNYEHVYDNGTLCLAVPIEERRIFWEQPSLLGFVNKLVIPYFFGYCYWKIYGKHPFDEQAHGAEGIVQHYVDTLRLDDEISALAVISYLLEYGYRGHHCCPCGSGIKVRKCHGQALCDLHKQHTELTLKNDFISVLDVCIGKVKSEELKIPEPLVKQIFRILDKTKH